eukprot:269742-Alexandrium_andersonii.AAC.1
MSASLVGSEMCIRDRSISAGGGGTRTPPLRNRPIAVGKIMHLLKCKTVSYTHLTLPTICSV